MKARNDFELNAPTYSLNNTTTLYQNAENNVQKYRVEF